MTAAFFFMASGRILVIRGGAIGDFILTLPALSALRQAFPETELHVLGYPHIAKLALLGGLAHEVRSIEAQALAGFFARGGNLSPDLTNYFSSFNLIISYLYDPDKIFQTNVARCTKAQFIAGPHRPNEIESIHATGVFLKPLERLAIFDADKTPRLLSAPDNRENKIAVHPGSGSEKKNWPEAKWCEFVNELTKRTSHDFLLIGGEAEGQKLHRLAGRLPSDRIQIVANDPLSEVARKLNRCSFFIGHDSGITHLAAAVDVPGVVLWGESNEQIWRPCSDKMTIIRAGNNLANLPASEVLKEVLARLTC